MTQELKACPFCGNQPVYWPNDIYSNGEETVFCADDNKCPVAPRTYGPANTGQAIAAWNTRTGEQA